MTRLSMTRSFGLGVASKRLTTRQTSSGCIAAEAKSSEPTMFASTMCFTTGRGIFMNLTLTFGVFSMIGSLSLKDGLHTNS